MSSGATMSWSGDAVPLRRRADLELRPSFASPAQAWLVKDPVALQYYELPEEEHFVWQLLDGRTTWSELRERYERAFAPQQIDGARLLQLVEELHRRGLVGSDRAGQGRTLQLRGKERRRSEWLRRFANPLAIRLPGFDPQPWLARLQPWVAPLFSRTVAAACVLLGVVAVGMVLVHFDDVRRELAVAAQFPELADWPMWIGAIIGAKVLHELAHAITCRRYGGECRELGLLLLCGIPCLYCDVTSMWMTPERWKRIAVGAAGLAVEVVLAAGAVLLWRFSEPGLVHSFCLHLAVVCSVGTILINANPLLRYDGYFILSDLVGLTNLGEQADAALRGTVSHWFFGESLDDERPAPSRYRHRLAAYALASTVYRWMLTIGVLWLIRRTLAPHGLTLLSDALAVLVVGSLLVLPLRRTLGALRIVRSGQRGDGRRFAVRATALVCFAAAVLLWPWPYRVAAPAVVRLHDAEYVYVIAGGSLQEAVTLGSQVQRGERLALLHDPPLRLEVLKLEADVARRRLDVANLERRRVADPSQGAALPGARELLKTTEQQWQHLLREQERLQIVATRSGTVLPLYDDRKESHSSPQETTERTSPLEPQRRGAYLAPGTPLCAVGDPTSLEAHVTIDQHEIEFVRPGQAVQLRFETAPDRTFVGRVIETAEVEVDDLPPQLDDADSTTPNDVAGRNAAAKVRYLARIALEGSIADLPVGSVGKAKIEAAPQSLWTRLRRSFDATFRFVWNAA